MGVWQATYAHKLKAKNRFGSKLVKNYLHINYISSAFLQMASSSGGRSSATSRISLHKINVYDFFCSRSLRGDVLPALVCSAVFLLHEDTPTRTTTSKTLSPCRWYMLKLSYRFAWIKCSCMCSKLSYYVSYNDPHRCKEATDLHKIFENIIQWLINYWICIALEAVPCNKLLVGWQFKYFHVRYIKITAHKISWGSIYNDGEKHPRNLNVAVK